MTYLPGAAAALLLVAHMRGAAADGPKEAADKPLTNDQQVQVRRCVYE